MNYSELTLHYFQTAAAAGVLTGPDVYRGAAGSRARGTWVQFDVQVNSGIIRAARFLAFACPHTIAVAAWVAERAAGPVSRAALPESVQDLSERFAVPVHCSAVAIEDSPSAPTSRGRPRAVQA